MGKKNTEILTNKNHILSGVFNMVKVYGIITMGDAQVFLGTYTKKTACEIMMDNTFIQRWNNEHIVNIYKLAFVMEN